MNFFKPIIGIIGNVNKVRAIYKLLRLHRGHSTQCIKPTPL